MKVTSLAGRLEHKLVAQAPLTVTAAFTNTTATNNSARFSRLGLP